MGLVTCPDCGKEVSDRAVACPQCGAPLKEQQPQQIVVQAPKVQKVVAVHPEFDAGHEAGRGCAMLLTSNPMAYVVFVVVWIFGGTYLGYKFGWFAEGEDPSLWAGFAVLVLPFILAYVLRKPITKVIPVIMGSGILIAVVAFFIFGFFMAVSMVYGLFFDWSSAQ